MAVTGDVNLTIADGGAGAVAVAPQRLQVVMGCCASGTAYAITASRQPSTILSTYSYGPATEAAGMAIRDGATVLMMRIPTTTAGAVAKKAAKVVSAATVADPSVITTTDAHGLVTGDVVTIAAVGGTTTVNGTWVVTVLTSTTFSVPVAGVGAYTSGGTVTPDGAVNSNTAAGAAEIYFTGAAYDDYFIQVDIVSITGSGTIGTDTIQFTVSLDAGRSVGLPRVTLDTSGATTYLIPQTNVTINFGTGDVAVGDRARGYTTAPLWTIADLTAGILALQNSAYAASGWGSIHIVGTIGGSDAGTVGTNLETMATAKVYSRAMGAVRDASPPTAWGGTGETDAVWGAAVLADYVSTTKLRFGVAAGHYNMRSVYPNAVCGLPLYRRNLAWAWAARVAGQLPLPADHEGWIRLGALSQITQNTVTDPVDGFVYHDERSAFVFDNLAGGPGRITAARTRLGGLTGWWISNPLTLAGNGSDFQLMPLARLIDIAASTVQAAAQPYVNQRLKLNRSGTIREGEALSIERAQYRALDVAIGNQISGRTIAVDRDWNVRDNNSIKITGSIDRDGYALEINETIGFSSSLT
jgi:hypothetical protein